jgi:LysR family glycine cleavage system transcriptional activator
MASKSQARILPSLRALHAFTQVARTQSAVAAAQSLGVTPSAISHLLRELEERLGIGLFDRSAGRFVLTEEGRGLYRDMAQAFDTIEEAVHRVLRPPTDLRISTIDTFAQFWLIPRLSRFQSASPSVELYISTTTRVVDLDAEGIDAAIRFGKGDWPRTQAERLHQELLLPVAHPALAAKLRNNTPGAIAELPLVHARTLRADWELWLRAAGDARSVPRAGSIMESRGNAILAAIAGVGAIVVDPIFIKDDLAAGRLVRLSDIAVQRPEGYWIVWSASRVPRGPLRQFITWLKAEFAALELEKSLTIVEATDSVPSPAEKPPQSLKR